MPHDRDLARDLLRDLRSSDESLPELVRQRQSDPRNVFLHYVFLRRVGEGAMATVWQAWHAELRKLVALKVLRSQLGAQAAMRFAREAQLAASLDHPHIVRVHHHGAKDGTHFIEMDYAPSRTLEAWLESQRAPLKERVALLAPVCRAAAYAHERSVVHRDITPRNILIGADGVPRLTDFGLAKAVDGPVDLTTTGQIMGTPRYMSPEQATAKEAGPRSDVYSLGSVLYRVATGQPPYAGESLVSVARQVAQSDPVRPSRIEAGVDAGLERVILKAMQRDPADRYADAGAMADDLERWIAGRAVQAVVRESGRPRGRAARPSAVNVLLLLVALIAGTGWLLTWLDLEKARAKSPPPQSAADPAPHVPAMAWTSQDPQAYAIAAGESLTSSARAALAWDHAVYQYVREGVWREPATLKAFPSGPPDRLTADRALMMGANSEALERYSALQAVLPLDPIVWLGSALAAYRAAGWKEAAAALDRYILLMPREDERRLEGTALAYALRGLCARGMARSVEADRYFRLALLIAPQNEHLRKLSER